MIIHSMDAQTDRQSQTAEGETADSGTNDDGKQARQLPHLCRNARLRRWRG